jgi:hypothetical protein
MPITNGPQPNDEHYAATVMPQPQVQQAERAYHATGSLQIPNSLATADGHSAQDFLNQILPYANRASTMTIAENQVRGQRNEQS